MEYNHRYIYNFFITIGGDVWTKKENANFWMIELNDEYFDETGILLNPLKGTNIDISNLSKYYDDVLINRIQTLIVNHSDLIQQAELTEAKRFLNYNDIKELYPEIYLITLGNEKKILKFFQPPNNLSEILNIYAKFSKIGITPRVHYFNFFYPGEPYTGSLVHLFIVTDYYPMRVKDIKDPNKRREAIQKVIDLAYYIENLGYYHQDLHLGNFLYDDINDKVYAINFVELTTNPNQKIKQSDIDYLLEYE